MKAVLGGLALLAAVAGPGMRSAARACFCDKDSLAREARARPLVAGVVLGRLGPSPAQRGRERRPRFERLAAAKQRTQRLSRIEGRVIDYLARLARDPGLVRQDLLGLSMLTVADPVPARPARRGPAEELALLIRSGWAENPHVWFALGRSLAHEGDNRLALRAFHRAASLGHPMARRETCETAKRFAEHASGGWSCPGVMRALDRAWRGRPGAAVAWRINMGQGDGR